MWQVEQFHHAMQTARSGQLDYHSAMALIRHAPGILPPRPATLGVDPGGAVFWEEQGHHRRRLLEGTWDTKPDRWVNSGGLVPITCLSDPLQQGPWIERKRGTIAVGGESYRDARVRFQVYTLAPVRGPVRGPRVAARTAAPRAA